MSEYRISINGVNEWSLNLPESSANEWIGNMKYHNNTWEMPRLRLLAKLVKEYDPANILYIGAYKGDMAALLAKLGARMALVESTPAFWSLIKETWELNPELEKPKVCFSGLISNETKNTDGLHMDEFPTRSISFVEGKSGFTHLAESKDDPTFPQITIDDLVERTAFIPDIITMDIEGSELEALKGSLKTIEKYHPDFVLSVHPEFMFHNHGTYERELHDLLRDRGYQHEWLDYDHEHHWYYHHKDKFKGLK